MNYFLTIADFLISQWMWGITWGIYHVLISALCMTLLLKVMLNMKIIRALILTVSAHVFAIALFTFVVVVGLMPFVDASYYTAHASPARINPGRVTLYLGLIYTVLEFIFFALVQGRAKFQPIKLFIIILLSNCLAAGLISLTLPCM